MVTFEELKNAYIVKSIECDKEKRNAEYWYKRYSEEVNTRNELAHEIERLKENSQNSEPNENSNKDEQD